MNKHVPLLALMSTLLALAACSRSPEADVPVEPATAATSAPPAPTAPAAQAAPAVEIFYAQVGNRLGSNNLLAESLAEVARDDEVYAMAVFKGAGGTSAEASVRVSGGDGGVAYSEEKVFTAGGEVPVVFHVTEDGKLPAGDYKALFMLDGVPCWEVAFKVN